MNAGFASLILASTSPRRSELLRVAGVEHRVVPSEAVECEDEHLTAWETAQLNAYRKARVVAKRFPDELVLGADTVVCLGTRLFGKPRDREEAERMLGELQGRTHQVVTGVCLLHLRTHRQQLFSDTTHVTFLGLRKESIRGYVERTEPMDKAGGYAIQDQGSLIVSEILGSFSNVVGLPIEALRAVLATWPGWAGEARI